MTRRFCTFAAVADRDRHQSRDASPGRRRRLVASNNSGGRSYTLSDRPATSTARDGQLRPGLRAAVDRDAPLEPRSRSTRADSITRRCAEGDPRIFGEQIGPGRSAARWPSSTSRSSTPSTRSRSATGATPASPTPRRARRWMRRSRRRRTTRSSRSTRRRRRTATSCSPKSSRRSRTAAPRPKASAPASAPRARSWRARPTTARDHAEPLLGIDFITERPARQLAAGSDQPASRRARRALGRGHAVRRPRMWTDSACRRRRR